MRVLFAGTPEVALPSLRALVASDHEVVGVLTQADARRGRGRLLEASPVGKAAEDLGLPTLKPERVNDGEVAAFLAEHRVDVCAVVAYGQLLGTALLSAVPWVNLHFSVLPRWRGAAPVQRSIMAGDATVGVTAFRIVKELDAGPVFASREWPADQRASSGQALAQLAEQGPALLLEALTRVGAGEPGTPQSDDGVTLAPKLTTDDARIDFSAPVDVVDRQIRACNPAPGGWTTFRGARLKVWQAHPTLAPGEPGVLVPSRQEVLVGTGSRALALDVVQPPGKKPMGALEWARGVSFESGEVLGHA